MGKPSRYRDGVTRCHGKRIRTVLCDCVGLANDIKKAITVKFRFTFLHQFIHKCKYRIASDSHEVNKHLIAFDWKGYWFTNLNLMILENKLIPQYCWFSHDVTKFQTSELLILLRFYFHNVWEQLKTNLHTNFHSEWVLGLVIDYAWISKLLCDVAFTWRARELWRWFKKGLISGNSAIWTVLVLE